MEDIIIEEWGKTIDIIFIDTCIDTAISSSFFFSLFHQRADDDALTRFLQTSLFLVASPILVKSMFLSFRSSLTLSIQVFLCLPLLLFPSTCPCKAAFGNLFSSILSMCPNHCSLLFLIFCTTVSSAPSSSLVCSFLTFSLLVLPMILLSQLISATSSLRSSSFLRLQHSEPHSKTAQSITNINQINPTVSQSVISSYY